MLTEKLTLSLQKFTILDVDWPNKVLTQKVFKKNINRLDFFSTYPILLVSDHIRLQELIFLSEYFLLTALFCFTLFILVSLKVSKYSSFSTKFIFNNQLISLLVFIVVCYLALLFQQQKISFLSLTSFNYSINNDLLSFNTKFIIGAFCVFYLLFIQNFLKHQKLNNFEYGIVLMTSIFGFFLLCCANDLVTSYLAIELQGLAFYVLASFKKTSNFSVESGVKYFVLGSLSTALFLLGITIIYGLSGSIVLSDFQDFFIWVFCTNSYLVSSDPISQLLDVFQEKNNVSVDLESTKLKVVSDKLALLGNQSSSGYEKVSIASMSPNAFDGQFLNKFTDNYMCLVYESVNLFSGRLINFDFFKAYSLLSSFNDSVIENLYRNDFFINFFQMLKSNTVNFTDFIALKSYFSNAIYYDNVNPSIDFTFNKNLNDIEKTLSPNFQGFAVFENFLSMNHEVEMSHVFSESCFLSFFQVSNYGSFLIESFEIDNSMVMFNLNFLVVGVLLVILALFFKLALAPFHLWSPDVYEGSPTSSTFFFMVLSKFGIFVFLLRFCYFSFYSLIFYWQFYSLFVASLSIFIGAVAGLKQRKLKSLLTYSSINNMGFVLLAFSAGSFEGLQMKFYYLIVYILASICLWGIVLDFQLKKSNVEKQNRELGDLVLIQESNPITAQNLGIILFSLAGLPPMVGFLAKMGVFKALSSVSIYYFSVLNILFSVIATFYYLRITKIVFFENALVGNLYETVVSKKIFIINFLTFLIVFLFFNPMFLHLCSYKMTLFLNKSFF